MTYVITWDFVVIHAKNVSLGLSVWLWRINIDICTNLNINIDFDKSDISYDSISNDDNNSTSEIL